jgi:Na+/H+ antiporter NhaD/arsenite permease-like protein
VAAGEQRLCQVSRLLWPTGFALCTIALPASAAGEESLDGSTLSLFWVLPFVGILLSIAIMPLAAPSFWHLRYGRVAAFWGLALLIPLAIKYEPPLTLHLILHTALLEYIPFIVLIVALFTVAGGIHIRGNLHGSPSTNTALLAIGTSLASLVGTTGASMVLIRPVLRANDDRVHNAHVVVFFIFLVSNIGGALTPLGDPPLFLGFLKGVDFFWPLIFLWQPTVLVSAILLALFYGLDRYLYAKEGHLPRDPTPDRALAIDGTLNFALLALLVGVVLASGLLPSFGKFHVFTVEMELKSILRDLALIAIALLSLKLTPQSIRTANKFSWRPALEVATLFAGIFVTIVPVIAILRAGPSGAMAGVHELVTGPGGTPDNAMYFWLTGALSSFLDNAPTYLVFFNAAGGDAQQLMMPLATTLMAISAGAVYMGANTYIGNAPNFMVKSIAEENGIKMPSFFGYMLWSGGFLVPCFLLVHWLFFR